MKFQPERAHASTGYVTAFLWYMGRLGFFFTCILLMHKTYWEARSMVRRGPVTYITTLRGLNRAVAGGTNGIYISYFTTIREILPLPRPNIPNIRFLVPRPLSFTAGRVHCAHTQSEVYVYIVVTKKIFGGIVCGFARLLRIVVCAFVSSAASQDYFAN